MIKSLGEDARAAAILGVHKRIRVCGEGADIAVQRIPVAVAVDCAENEIMPPKFLGLAMHRGIGVDYEQSAVGHGSDDLLPDGAASHDPNRFGVEILEYGVKGSAYLPKPVVLDVLRQRLGLVEEVAGIVVMGAEKLTLFLEKSECELLEYGVGRLKSERKREVAPRRHHAELCAAE